MYSDQGRALCNAALNHTRLTMRMMPGCFGKMGLRSVDIGRAAGWEATSSYERNLARNFIRGLVRAGVARQIPIPGTTPAKYRYGLIYNPANGNLLAQGCANQYDIARMSTVGLGILGEMKSHLVGHLASVGGKKLAADMERETGLSVEQPGGTWARFVFWLLIKQLEKCKVLTDTGRPRTISLV